MASMEAEVKALVLKNPSYQIWVTGHSLGGAMASLASTWLGYYNIALRKNIILYTFGMPRVDGARGTTDVTCQAPLQRTLAAERKNIVEKSHCADELSRYDPALSYKMLLLSAVAYDPVHPQECLDNSLPYAEFQLQTVVTKNCDFADHGCSGYVAVSRALKAIVVAFRGSLDLIKHSPNS
ncbi:hypothetical protein OS493_030331 [Desmophyllum pertusum]|uniref:Fungal lipase-type domain-containing protein n=1 Tax=Desmophyllum pertusum TaxID=174260 RepID=A0A9W9ZK19_9CNID|nr:hypothetical protein OS493_030331 [Desmophyllum pertusum]